jgi:hypothetical protein
MANVEHRVRKKSRRQEPQRYTMANVDHHGIRWYGQIIQPRRTEQFLPGNKKRVPQEENIGYYMITDGCFMGVSLFTLYTKCQRTSKNAFCFIMFVD